MEKKSFSPCWSCQFYTRKSAGKGAPWAGGDNFLQAEQRCRARTGKTPSRRRPGGIDTPVEAQRGRKRGGGQVPDAETVDVGKARRKRQGEGCTFLVQGTRIAEKFPTAPKPHSHTVSDGSLETVATSAAGWFLGKAGGEGERGSKKERTFLCAGCSVSY